ncbi:hypothetical protein HWI79_1567 [Cryptosporidium felis]|nr:hypothetical protein HWI79_1567 [Cryptosporidium felis]
MRLFIFNFFVLGIIWFQNEFVSIRTSGAIPKVFKQRKNSLEISDNIGEFSLPKDGRCSAVGDTIAENKKTSKQLIRFLKCVVDASMGRFATVHEKNIFVAEKCGALGFKVAETTKLPALDCIYCFREILEALEGRHPELGVIISDNEKRSIARVYIVVAYLEKNLRHRLRKIAKYVSSTNWYSAYSEAREFCGYIVLVYDLWTRVMRDKFWPYAIIVSNNYNSRYPVEYQCPYSSSQIVGIDLQDDKDLTALLESPLTFT